MYAQHQRLDVHDDVGRGVSGVASGCALLARTEVFES